MAEPPVTIRAKFSSFRSGDNTSPTRIVIHATCPSVGYPAASAPGAQHGTALYFASGNAGGSAHYIEGVDGEEHCVPDNTIAYHAPPNEHSLGIEICAEGGDYSLSYSRAQWLSPQVWPAVQRAAARASELCDRFGVPKVRIGTGELLAGARGICGHVDVSQAWHQSTHSDPGPAFPWPEFMAEVLNPQGADMPLTDADVAKIMDWPFGPLLPGGPDLSFGQFLKAIPDFLQNATGGDLRNILANEEADGKKLDALASKVGGGQPVQVDAGQVANALASNTAFLAALAKAVNDDAAKRLAS